jgi:SAM-dependent methyltransferase
MIHESGPLGAVRERLGARFSPAKLFLISFSILFLEMASIRWLNAAVSALAYFNNLILISCFFGLGVGCLLATLRTSLVRWYPVALLIFVAAVMFLNRHAIDISYTEDVIYASEYDPGYGVFRLSFSALAGFTVNTVLFVLLGQELGKQIAAVGDPIRAYAYDIAGSLLGVILYALLAWAGTPPHVWYGVGGLLLLFFLGGRAWTVAGAGVLLGTLGLMATSYGDARWSPYYKVEVHPYRNAENVDLGFYITVNNLRIQDALNFSPDLARSGLWPWLPYYELPYHLVQPKKVLVLGAGCGNEAIVALMHGAERVDAVEIDPVIAGYGRSMHPNAPYSFPNVQVVVDDARAFLSSAEGKYDLIVMSALDSHRQIAGMSSLRLESFFYTVESYRQARKLLAPGGVFCLNLGSTRPWMGDRTYWSLTEAFGEEPRILRSLESPFGSVAYVYAPADYFERDLLADAAPLTALPPLPRADGVRLSTDDWPYLYLERNRIPALYLVVLGMMIVVSVAIVVAVDPSVRRPNLHFFLLGAGFMLLETRSVTQMALLFGSTWSVNAVVFASILATIFLANHMVRTGRAPRPAACYILLFVTLAAGYFFPFNSLLSLSLVPRLAAAGVAVGLPVLWASFIFSDSFRGASRVAHALGSNLLGVVLGGCLEYASNVAGLSALYLVALALYGGSWLFMPALRSR